jgi:hypothetical protein
MKRAIAALAAVAVTLAACTHGGGSSTGTAPHEGGAGQAVGRASLTGNQRHYGADVRPDQGIVYQPNVVLIGGGADAVRSVSSNGLVWTIAGDAPGVRDLAVGKIMAVTSLGIGRVLKSTRVGADQQVVLGPVSLTDVVRDASIHSTQPLSLDNPLYYATPGAPASAASGGHAPRDARERLLMPRRPMSTTSSLTLEPTLPEPTSTPTPVQLGRFAVTAFRDNTGIGMQIFEKHGTGKLRGRLSVYMHSPTVEFTLIIRNSRIVEATVRLHGAGGVHVAFTAVERDASGSFADQHVFVPVELAFPLSVDLFRLTIAQSFDMSMLLTGAAWMTGHGDYSIHGDLTFGVRNGAPVFDANALTVADPIDRNVESAGVASNTLNVGYAVKVGITIGVPDLSAGAWMKLRFGLNIIADTQLSELTRRCTYAAVSADMQFGVGYELPEVLVDAVNLFLSVFGVPKIAAKGGKAWGPIDLLTPPRAKYCPPR